VCLRRASARTRPRGTGRALADVEQETASNTPRSRRPWKKCSLLTQPFPRSTENYVLWELPERMDRRSRPDEPQSLPRYRVAGRRRGRCALRTTACCTRQGDADHGALSARDPALTGCARESHVDRRPANRPGRASSASSAECTGSGTSSPAPASERGQGRRTINRYGARGGTAGSLGRERHIAACGGDPGQLRSP